MNGNDDNRDDELPGDDQNELPEDIQDEETEVPAEDPIPGTGKRMPRSPATKQERLTLKKILERVGGAGTGRVRLYVKRIDRLGTVYKLPPIRIDQPMVDTGLDAAEVIGPIYGNGYYDWELRFSGRYVHGDKEHLLGYKDSEANEPPAKAYPDLPSLVGQLKSDLLNELRPKEAPVPPVDIAAAVRSALDPIVRLLEVRTLEVAARQPSKEADPATAAILGILSQQNQTLLGLVSKALETPKFRPEPAPAPIPNPAPVAPVADSLKSRVSDLKELLSLSREIGGSAYPQVVAYDAAPGGDDGDGGDDDDDDSDDDSGDSFDGMDNPAETGNPVVDFISRIKTHFLGTADRMTKEVLQVSEEKMKTGLLAGLSKPVEQGSTDRADIAPITAPIPQAPAAAPSVPQSQSAATFVESLVGSIEQCVREKRPVQEFLTLITTGAPEGFVSTVKQLSVDQIVAFGATIERPDLTERFRQPEVHKYLAEALSALKGGDAK